MRLAPLLAERARVGRPRPEAARDHVADNRADVSSLRRRIAGPGVVAGDRQRPRALLRLEDFQEVGGIFDVVNGIEHLAQGTELGAVEVVVDLHAADVDELRPAPLGAVKRAIASARLVE